MSYATQESNDMQNATPTEDVRRVWEPLYAAAEAAEMALLEIADCLRTERECVTLFDAPGLLKVLARREKLVAEFESGRSKRREAVESAWAQASPEVEIPAELPDVLRAVADIEGTDEQRLTDAASELEVLGDVVRELHELNKVLLERAMTWVSLYVTELMGSTGTQTYDGSGRMRGRGGTLLRRTI